MGLSELEKTIIVAERDYTNIYDKLNHVNTRLGHKKKINPTDKNLSILPGHEKQVIRQWKYYETLRILNSKTKVRAKDISRNRLSTLINEHDGLIADRPEIRNALTRAKADGKWGAVARLINLQAETGQRIASLDESIYYLTIDPTHISQELEKDMEYEERLNEKIRLFTNIT